MADEKEAQIFRVYFSNGEYARIRAQSFNQVRNSLIFRDENGERIETVISVTQVALIVPERFVVENKDGS
jgi:leucyl aminopeptidase (aminopeptidase T)